MAQPSPQRPKRVELKRVPPDRSILRSVPELEQQIKVLTAQLSDATRALQDAKTNASPWEAKGALNRLEGTRELLERTRSELAFRHASEASLLNDASSSTTPPFSPVPTEPASPLAGTSSSSLAVLQPQRGEAPGDRLERLLAEQRVIEQRRAELLHRLTEQRVTPLRTKLELMRERVNSMMLQADKVAEEALKLETLAEEEERQVRREVEDTYLGKIGALEDAIAEAAKDVSIKKRRKLIRDQMIFLSVLHPKGRAQNWTPLERICVLCGRVGVTCKSRLGSVGRHLYFCCGAHSDAHYRRAKIWEKSSQKLL